MQNQKGNIILWVMLGVILVTSIGIGTRYYVQKLNSPTQVEKSQSTNQTVTQPIPVANSNLSSAICASIEKYYSYYTKDKNNVYCGDVKIDGADPATFEYIGLYDENPEGMPAASGIAKDKNCIYRADKKILDANGACVNPIKCTKDSLQANCGIAFGPSVDTNTLQTLTDNYAKDRNRVYWSYQVVKGADPNTFQVLSNGYSKDKYNVYMNGQLLQNSDPSTFKILDFHYGKDKADVYFEDKLVNGADPATFQALGYDLNTQNDFAKDKNNVYIKDAVLNGADAATFQIIMKTYYSNTSDSIGYQVDTGYQKDKNRVYYHLKIMEGANPVSFQPPSSGN